MVEVDGKPLRPADKDHRQIVLVFDSESGTLSGMTGCNDLQGRVHVNGSTLTMKTAKPLPICRADRKTENALNGIIRDTRGYRISGRTLELLNQKGQAIAKLVR